jgi:hypothetical protein
MTMSASKLEQLKASHQATERDTAFFIAHPELLEPYRGQWIVIHECRVIAHSPDGSGLAERAPLHKYPGSSMFYLPTREELEGVWVI